MAINHMAEVAKMLGVELDEEFKCKETNCTYRVTKNGFLCNGCYGADSMMIFLKGHYTIEKLAYKPKEDEKYWCVGRDGLIHSYFSKNDIIDFFHVKLGNCYRTKEEAEANKDKWLKFYESDEVLEVR